MNADGTDPIKLTNFAAEPTPSNVNVTKPTWSPKGDRISFHRRVGLQGTGPLRDLHDERRWHRRHQITFTQTPGFSGFPSWGKWGTEP